jgi:hypothetical protein
MTSDYVACDEELYRFREENENNDEIKRIFFKNKSGTIFKVDVFNHYTFAQLWRKKRFIQQLLNF